jgi:hypothetical protein
MRSEGVEGRPVADVGLQKTPHNQIAVNGAATVIETFEILLDGRMLVAELEKIQLVEASEGVEQRLWKT